MTKFKILPFETATTTQKTKFKLRPFDTPSSQPAKVPAQTPFEKSGVVDVTKVQSDIQKVLKGVTFQQPEPAKRSTFENTMDIASGELVAGGTRGLTAVKDLGVGAAYNAANYVGAGVGKLLFETLGVAENAVRGKDNGVILSIFIQDRQMRIEVGYGLEGALPDALAGKIIANELQSS